MTTSSPHYLTQLHQLLNQHFNLAEIQDLCFRLGIDYESVSGDEKPARIRALLLGLARQNRLPDLIAIAQQLRPRVEWPTMPDDFQLPESLPLEPAAPTNQYHIYGDFVQGDKIAGDKVMGDKHEHHHHHYPPEKKPPPPRMALQPPADFVHRPQEYEQLIAYLLAEEKQTVAITATLQGAGGFGKTTLAQAICHDERILSAFPDGILWTTIGDDRTKVIPGLQKLYQALTGEEARFVDEHDATVQLIVELDKRRCLLVIDDVWNYVHLKPFLQGGAQCARLITTRIASVVSKETEPVAVDAMRQTEAIGLLGAGLDAPDTDQLAVLAGRLGEWPLLLKLVNRRLYEDVQRHSLPLPEAIAAVNEELDEFGLTSFDADNAEERDQAVAASMSVSLRQLRPDAKYGRTQVDEATRFRELAIFPEDAVIPISVVALLWGETGQLSAKATDRLCRRLANLSLLLTYDQQTQTIQLHDVTRHYLIEQATNEQYQAWQERLLNGYETKCAGNLSQLPNDGYVYQHLLWHMREAGQQGKLEQLLLNYDWLDAKLQATDVLSLISDFDLRRDTRQHSQLGLLQHALQMSMSVLAQGKNQLASQLYGRLSGLGETWQPFVDTIQQQEREHWLQTQIPNLSPPGGNLIYTLNGHTDGVSNLLLTRDGRLVSSCRGSRFSSGNDHTVKVWDVDKGILLHSLEGHTDGVSNLLLTGNGHLVSSCSGNLYGNSRDHTVKVWNIETGTLLHNLEGHTDGVNNLLLTGNGHLVSSCNKSHSNGSRDPTVKVWDIERGILLHSLEGHTNGVDNLLLTSDGRLISSCCSSFSDPVVKVWDIEQGVLLYCLEGHTNEVDNLLLTGDGRLISSCRFSDPVVKVWDIERGVLLHNLESHSAGVANLLLIGDSYLIASCRSSFSRHTIKVWDIDKGALLHNLEGHSDEVTNLLLTRGGYLVSSCADSNDDHTVKVWDIETGTLLRNLEGHNGGVANLLLTDDGRLVSSCSSCDDHTVKVWDIESGALLHNLESHSDEVANLLLTRDGRLVSSCSIDSDDYSVKVWDIETGTLLHNLEGHIAPVDNLLLTENGHLVSSCSSSYGHNDYMLRVWDIDIETGPLLHNLEYHSDGVNNLLLTGNSRLVSSCSGRHYGSNHDHTVKVWDIESGALLHSLEGHTEGANRLRLTGDGRLVSSCRHSDYTVKVWNIETGTLLHSLEGHTGGVANLLLTGDGRLISSCSNFLGHVKVWDIETGTLLHNLEGHIAPVDNLLLTENDRLVSSCSSRYYGPKRDHTVKVWDIESGALLHNLEGHTNSVDNLLLTGDGRLLSSCHHSDHTVKVWNIETGTLLHSLEGHTGGAANLLLTGNGRLVSSCSKFPGHVKVWDIETGTLLHNLEGHTDSVDNLLLTGDGRLLSSCYSNDAYTVKVWDIDKGNLLHNLESRSDRATKFVLTGDGRLISSYRYLTMKVWDIETGVLLHSIDDHISSISFMAFLPMSSYLMTVGGTQLIIWQIDEGRQVAGFTADGRITSYTIMSDDRIILGDRLGRVHFLKLVGPRYGASLRVCEWRVCE